MRPLPNMGQHNGFERQLSHLLVTNKQGAVDTLQEFSASFGKLVKLRNSDGKLIPRQLANFNRAIHYGGERSPEPTILINEKGC